MSRSLMLPLVVATLFSAPLAAQATPPTPPRTPSEAPQPPKPFTPEENARYMALGKKVNTWFFEGQADSIYAIADSSARAAMGGVEGIEQQLERFSTRAGAMLRIIDEKMTRREGAPQFWFEAEFAEFSDDALVLRWIFNEQGQLTGAGMGPKGGARKDG
jgi:hypothetical protein